MLVADARIKVFFTTDFDARRASRIQLGCALLTRARASSLVPPSAVARVALRRSIRFSQLHRQANCSSSMTGVDQNVQSISCSTDSRILKCGSSCP